MRILLLATALFLAACASNPSAHRIKRHPELYAKLSEREKADAARGLVSEGMSRDAVFIAWGRPDRVMSGSRKGRGRERWAYFGSMPVSTFSVGYGTYGPHPFYTHYGVHPAFGYGYGPGWGFGPGIDYMPVVDRSVEFANDRVVAWERTR